MNFMACNSSELQALRQHLRNQALSQRHKMRRRAQTRLSFRIGSLLSPLLKDKQVLAYFPVGKEPNLIPIQKSPFYLPTVQSHVQMLARQFIPKHLSKNKFGIWEPIPTCPIINPKDLEVVIVPALLVDTSGNRLGFGKGYYDRFLTQCPQALKIACVYDWQIVHKLPSLKHDIAMDMIISERRILSYRISS